MVNWLAELGPLIQAPMAGLGNSALAVASMRAGIVGSIGVGMLSPQQIRDELRSIREGAPNKPFNVNMFVLGEDYSTARPEVAEHAAIGWLKRHYQEAGVPFSIPESYAPKFDLQLAAVEESQPPIVSFTFGCPSQQVIDRLKAHGSRVIGTATSLKEARVWAQLKADAVVLQGFEAGGHRGSFLDLDFPGVGLHTLLCEVVRANLGVPLIAAGGIMDSAGIQAALALGADAVQLGTIFLQTPEASIAHAYSAALKSAKSAEDTCLTRAFTGRYARGVRNKFMTTYEAEPVLPYPLQNALTQPLRKAAAGRGDWQDMSTWAGQGVGLIPDGTVADVVKMLTK